MVEKPTDIWRRDMLEYPSDFPIEGIEEAERVIDKFVASVKGLSAPNDYDRIVKAYGDCIVALNAMNENTPMIDTLQANQLARFFFPLLAEMGIPQDADSDLSLNWRDW